jgi:hypothetical protein
MSTPSRLEIAIERLKFTRQFTSQFLAGLSDDEWFWCPSELTTHLAWQVGHLAVAQYNLCLRRIRGRTEADQTLIPDSFIECFKLGSTPAADPAKNSPLAEIQRVFGAVHQQALAELAGRTDAQLDVPVEQPHPVFKTKLGAVEWSSQHELVHAGQIALLRRLMGKPPLR